MNEIKEVVKRTYTNVVNNATGCCSPSCCSPAEDSYFGEDYSAIEGYEKDADFGLGCGIPTKYAQIAAGNTVLDLGAGAGNDVFIARSIVGDTGQVLGVDMTEAMIDMANANKQKLGYENVEFLLGDIEDLPIEDHTVDVVISNCVLNLVPNKLLAYSEIYRVLKSGGHFCISDIALNGDLPVDLLNAAEMYAGCASGALERSEYLDVIKRAGFKNVIVVEEHQINIPDEMLLRHISKDDLSIYRKSENAILSITVYGRKEN